MQFIGIKHKQVSLQETKRNLEIYFFGRITRDTK